MGPIWSKNEPKKKIFFHFTHCLIGSDMCSIIGSSSISSLYCCFWSKGDGSLSDKVSSISSATLAADFSDSSVTNSTLTIHLFMISSRSHFRSALSAIKYESREYIIYIMLVNMQSQVKSCRVESGRVKSSQFESSIKLYTYLKHCQWLCSLGYSARISTSPWLVGHRCQDIPI